MTGWQESAEPERKLMFPKHSFDVMVVGDPELEDVPSTFQGMYPASGAGNRTGGNLQNWTVVINNEGLPPVYRSFRVGESKSLHSALELAESIVKATRISELFLSQPDIERLPAMHRVDWMVDNVPGQYLPALTKELLRTAIQSCRYADIHGLMQFVVDWEATVEELIADGEELDEVLLARDEIREGNGIPWEEAKKGLGL